MLMNRIHLWLSASLFTSVLCLSSLFKVNLIWGSKAAFFSAFNLVGPLSGACGNFTFISIIFGLLTIIKAFFTGAIHNSLLAYHIPTMFASAYWRSAAWILRCGVPLLCMALFIIHPVGNQAFFYTSYWLIPIILYYLPYTNTFLTALGSTFVAHAVGSVLWLYLLPLQSELFIMLMPVVAIERLLYASGMTLLYTAGTYTKYLYASWRKTLHQTAPCV